MRKSPGCAVRVCEGNQLLPPQLLPPPPQLLPLEPPQLLPLDTPQPLPLGPPQLLPDEPPQLLLPPAPHPEPDPGSELAHHTAGPEVAAVDAAVPTATVRLP